MLTLTYWLTTLTRRAHAVVGSESVEFQVCCCFSLLGLVASLAFLHLYGPAAFLSLADAG